MEWDWLIVQGPGHGRPVLPVNRDVLCHGRDREPIKDGYWGKEVVSVVQMKTSGV